MTQIKMKCDKCNEEFAMDVEYEYVNSDIRQMGTEKIYSAEIDAECPNCHNPITGTIEYWEYPNGCIDHKNDDNLNAANVSDFGVKHGLD
mgnify:FL=1